jgi:hypothetical protein
VSHDPLDIARAWRDRIAADGGDPPQPCEGCALPATTADSEGVPLCDACGHGLHLEWCREAEALLRKGDALVEELTWGDHAARAEAWLGRVRAIVGVERG